MKPRKRTAQGTLTIDGVELRWELTREAQYTTNDGAKGMAFSVRADGGKAFRELMLEFPYPRQKPGYHQEKERVSPQAIEKAIRLAMEDGWDPTSRGRVFAFQVPENPV
jgi:hypothetical protein